MKLLEFNDDFEKLHKMGILKKERSMHPPHFESPKDHFTITEVISDAIIRNQPMPNLSDNGYKDVIEFLEALYKLGNQRDDEIISSTELFDNADEMIEANLHFSLIKYVHDFQYPLLDTYLYFYLIWKTISGQESCDIVGIMDLFFDRAPLKVRQMLERRQSKIGFKLS